MSDTPGGRLLINVASSTSKRGLERPLAAWPLLASYPDVGAGSA